MFPDPDIILVLSPHTDDGELGCGGALARLAAVGKTLHYVSFSLCQQSLPKDMAPDTLARECRRATGILGIPSDHIKLFEFDVRHFPSQRQEILEQLVILNKTIQPSLVFIPSSSDTHQDHAVIHAEAIRAFRNCSVLGYELPWNQQTAHQHYFVPLTEDHLSKKIEALSAYASQAARRYMQASFIRSLATVRGVQAHCQYAEAFEVIRIIGTER